MDKTKDFKTLVEHFLFTYQKFCLNKILHKKVDTKLYKKFISTWNIVLRSLEADYMMGLAKFFEQPKDIEKTISIYLFLDYQFKKYDKVIIKICNWRNKFFAHLDARASRNSGTFLKENKLNRIEINALFDTAIKVIDQLGNNLKIPNLKQQFTQTKKEVQNECDRWLRSMK